MTDETAGGSSESAFTYREYREILEEMQRLTSDPLLYRPGRALPPVSGYIGYPGTSALPAGHALWPNPGEDPRIGLLTDLVFRLSGDLKSVERQLRDLSLSSERFRMELISSQQRLGELEALYDERIYRFINVSIYLGTGRDEARLASMLWLRRLLDRIDFEVAVEFEPIESSWWKRLIGKSKDVINRKEVQDRMAKVEEALELKHVELVKSEATKNASEALGFIAGAVKDDTNALIVVNNLAYLKTVDASGRPITIARTLTREQQDAVEANPGYLTDPSAFYAMIQNNPSAPTPDVKQI